MAFEGEDKIIPIKGIVRTGADTVCEDGAMNEIIGLEYKDGSYVPYAPTKEWYQIPKEIDVGLGRIVTVNDILGVCVHKADDENVIILASVGASQVVSFIKKDLLGIPRNYPLQIYTTDSKVIDIKFVGNVLAITTEDDFVQFLYMSSDRSYTEYFSNHFFDGLPKIDFRATRYSETNLMKGDAGNEKGNVLYEKSTTGSEFTKELFATLATTAQYKVRENGRVCGHVIAVAAYKMLNGDYRVASAPVLLLAPNATKYIKNGDDYVEIEKAANAPLDYSNPFGDKWEKGARCSDIKIINSKNDITMSGGGTSVGDSNPLDDYAYHPTSPRIPSLFGYQYGGNEYVGAYGNIIQYKWKNALTSDLYEKYKGHIDSLCIFLSPEVSNYKEFTDKEDLSNIIIGDINISTNIGNSSTTDTIVGITFATKFRDEIIDDFDEIKNFYKVAEIPLEDLKSSINFKDLDLKGKLGDNLYTAPTLPISAFDRSLYIGGYLSSYNSRLNHFNYQRELFEGYDEEEFHYYPHSFVKDNKGEIIESEPDTEAIPDSPDRAYGQYMIAEDILSKKWAYSYTVVRIKDEKGRHIVCHENGSLPFILNPLLTYPDKNAYGMTIYTSDDDTNWYSASFDLKPSKHGGFAYCIASSRPDVITCLRMTNEGRSIDTGYYPPINELFKYSSSYVERYPSNEICNYRNVLRVSNVGFTYAFDNVDYYIVGDGSIMNTALVGVLLTQDNFGLYPLTIFCSDGIYTLEINKSGSSAYTSVNPFSRKVCVNRNSVCPIDGNVIFASVDGLKLATSNGVIDFASHILNNVRNIPNTSNEYGLGLNLYNKIIDGARLDASGNSGRTTDLLNKVCNKDILEILKHNDTVVSYISEINKVIIYNKNEAFSILIDVNTQQAYKLGIPFEFDNNDYPTEEYYLGNDIYKFDKKSSVGNIDTLIQTRPIKLSSAFNKGIRVILRGHFECNQEYGIVPEGFYCSVLLVLGSYDAIHWQPLGVNQRPTNKSGNSSSYDKGFNDIGCVVDTAACRYIMLIYTGKLNANSHIDYIEINSKIKYNDKLR